MKSSHTGVSPMTSRERVLAALALQPVDRTPVINPTSVATVELMDLVERADLGATRRHSRARAELLPQEPNRVEHAFGVRVIEQVDVGVVRGFAIRGIGSRMLQPAAFAAARAGVWQTAGQSVSVASEQSASAWPAKMALNQNRLELRCVSVVAAMGPGNRALPDNGIVRLRATFSRR